MKARHADPPNAAMDNDDARRNFISIFFVFLSLSLSLFFYIYIYIIFPPRGWGDGDGKPFPYCFSLPPLLEKG